MVSKEDAKALLRDGIDIAKSGDKKLAHTLLAQATRLDPGNEQAWLWLAGVSPSRSEAVDCLEHILSLNPENQAARKGLATLGINESKTIPTTANAKGPKSPPPAYHEAVTLPSGSNGNRPAVSPFANTTPTSGGFHPMNLSVDKDQDLDLLEPSPVRLIESPSPETDAIKHLGPIAESDEQSNISRVLIVDDSPTIRKLVCMTLGKQGYEVVTAADGMEALARINDGAPDLILLDITMPRMDGYQLCRTIKGNNITGHIPIVMLTGKDGFMDKVRGKMVGSAGYLTKPFKPDELVQMVEQHVKRR
jgi:CheY-like chemotaxis protein